MPRFGSTADIASVINIETSSLDTTVLVEYIRGTVFVAGMCLATFIVWILALIVCKVLGRRVGIAAGRPFVEYGRPPKSHLRFRYFMLISSFVIMLSGLLFFTNGGRRVGNVFDDIRDGTSVS